MAKLRFLTHTRYQGKRFRKGDIVELSEKDVKFLVANGLAVAYVALDEESTDVGTDEGGSSDRLPEKVELAKQIDEEWKLDELRDDMDEVGIVGIDKSLKKADLIEAIIESGQAPKLLDMLEDDGTE
ncbi:hypothetical protein [Exiguobacterium sp. NG55]|uniref:hypothetical protein n=1 Tax=Exiguobacterium sp. NG55 TaxID=375477 RepID=UPI0004DF7F9B|nr:hypothetical protein [Exiguobacterium sp. NG55]